ncbi:MAG TPA: hypothetical protein VG347_16675 [Verrucomicrobiae bacterium]|nr:hypothetical protein [Verrucomicrobiae bacterium]
MSPEQHARRWKRAGGIVLAVGVVAAGVVYGVGSREAALADEASMQGFYKSEAHQMGMLYGKQGLLMDDLSNDLKQPGTQAGLILVVAAVGAVGCFVFAKFPEVKDDNTEGRG